MNANEINALEPTLCKLFDRIILNAITKIYNGNKLQEPDYVAALAKYFAVDLSTLLNIIYPRYDFTISSVFCHQKPIVDINVKRKPELGDILFVYSEEQNDGSTIYNSLLLQAKITDHPIMKVSSAESHQLKLYKDWPAFTYYRANFLTGQTRNTLPKTINDGAQYLLIDDNPATNGLYCNTHMFPMGCAIPDDILIIDKSLSTELVEFLKFKAGRTFEGDPLSTQDDWTKMIWDLLLMGAFTFNRRNVGKINVARGIYCSKNTGFNGTSMFAKLKNYSDSFGNNYPVDCCNDNMDVGVSTIIIERKPNKSDK